METRTRAAKTKALLALTIWLTTTSGNFFNSSALAQQDLLRGPIGAEGHDVDANANGTLDGAATGDSASATSQNSATSNTTSLVKPSPGPEVETAQDRENRKALKDSELPSKTKLPGYGKKTAPYMVELQDSQKVKQIGKEQLKAVDMPSSRIHPEEAAKADTDNDQKHNEEHGVVLTRPPLQALITVQDNLNPSALDARYWERISLPDALNASLGQNLDINSSYASMRQQKYKYLSAFSGFLPDLTAGYSLAALNGSIPSTLFGGSSATAAGGAATPSSSKLPSSVQFMNAGFTYNAYQGGKVLFGTLEQKHRLRASRAALKGSVNDVLMATARRYYDLLYNEALLDIRVRAVEISQEQVRINEAQEKAGTATGLDVLQSQSQLASDQQNLVDQQSTRRQSAIQLAYVMNTSFAQDVTCAERTLYKRRLIQRSVPIEQLLQAAIDNRPELKQYEELRIAAKRAIVVAAAPLQPNVKLAGTVYGVGTGGNVDPIYVLNFSVNWRLGALGTTDLANIQAARWQSRQSAINAKRAFLDVFQQVRTSYDQSLAADKRIEHASAQIAAAEEELRIATKRMRAGIGLNIDVLNAQRDLTQAGINKARALVDFNVAQSQLLHDIGLIKVSTLTNGATM